MSASYEYRYRGYVWLSLEPYSSVTASVYIASRLEFVHVVYAPVYYLGSQSHHDVPRTAQVCWKEARDQRHTWRSGARKGGDVASCDGVPWEIHEIEDEETYQIALASYLANI